MPNLGRVSEIKGDQLNMALFFWYLFQCTLLCTCTLDKIPFLQGTKNTRLCITGHPVPWHVSAEEVDRVRPVAGVYKVIFSLIFFHTPFLKSLFYSPKFSSFSLLDILPNSLIIMLHLSIFPVIVFSTSMIFPSPLHNLIFFPNRRLDKLYTPDLLSMTSLRLGAFNSSSLLPAVFQKERVSSASLTV